VKISSKLLINGEVAAMGKIFVKQKQGRAEHSRKKKTA